MCGIAGIVARRPVNPAAVQSMIDRMAHRGPDGEGLWVSDDERVVLGHRRLAVIDPTPAGAQPMLDPSGRRVLTFNGEIYNYLELAARLRGEGWDFRSSSDTEVLLAAHETWGADGVGELNGMFAYALFDAEARRLLCVRDRFGEKPLLYAETPEFFAFASEYKALFALLEVSADIDPLRLAAFLHQPKRGLDDSRETVFAGIKQMLPGERLTVDAETLEVRVERYWTLTPDEEAWGLSEVDAIERFKDLLSESVAIRMRSDVPVGSCLSGGLDSSAIVCLNRAHVGPGQEYHTFTGRFPGTPSDEWRYAEDVIDAAEVTSHVVAPAAGGFLEELRDFVWFNELPVGSSSQYAQWGVFRLAKDHGVTVLLDGQGADELLAGYEQYFAQYLQSRRAAGDLPADEEEAIRARYPAALMSGGQKWLAGLPHRVRRALAGATNKGSDFLFGLAPDIAAGVEKLGVSMPGASAELHPLTAALAADAFHHHLPTLLRYGDRNSMAHSREVRLPFCDHRIAELALSLPAGHLMGGAETKRLLRRAMQDVLPNSIQQRWNKQGFLPPQDQWLSGELLAWARETVESPAFGERGLWDVGWWRRALERMLAGEAHLAWQIWKPLIGEAWYQHFVGRIGTEPRVAALGGAAGGASA